MRSWPHIRRPGQTRLARNQSRPCRASWRVLRHGLPVVLCLIVVIARADLPNAVYQPPQHISAADRQVALDELDRFVAKLGQLRAEIDRSLFDLDALLERSEFDEQKVIAFVRDDIRFEQYPGLLRGAEGTLISGAGNALDQALLLATLLKNAGLDARIVHGRISAEQARLLLAGIGASTADSGHVATDRQAWDARLAELHDLSGAPPPQRYAPLEEAPFFAVAQRTTNELLQALQDANIDLAGDDTNSLLAEARDYYWVEARLGPGDAWQAHHPALGTAIESAPNPIETFGQQLPERLQHRLRIEVFIEQKLGKQLQTHRVAGPWERPVANLNGVVLSYRNQPNTLDAEAIKTGIGAAVNKANLFIPILNGEPGKTAFDLNGWTIDVESLGMDAFGAGAVFQTVGDKAGLAANTLSAMGATDDSNSTDLVALTAHWIEYTLIRPGGEESRYRRMLLDRRGAASRAAGQMRLRAMSEADIRRALTVQHQFMVATGSYSQAYTAERVLQRLIDVAPAWRLMVRYLYGGNIKLGALQELDPSPLPHLALYRTFDLGPQKLGAPIAYRASPSLVVLRDGLLTEERGFRSVDVVANDRRVLSRDKFGRLRVDAQKAVAIGVWETAIETLAHDYFGPANAEYNTFAVFDSAQRQGIKAQVLPPHASDTRQVSLDDDGRVHLRRDLDTGHAVLIPLQAPAGLAMTGWWRVDPASGTTLGMTADGRGQDAMEYLTNLVGNAITLINGLAKYIDCKQYKDAPTRACCLLEAHMNNVGGMAMGGLLGSSLGAAGSAVCGAGGFLRGEIENLAGTNEPWSCRVFDGRPDDMAGSGGIVNTGFLGCGLLQDQ